MTSFSPRRMQRTRKIPKSPCVQSDKVLFEVAAVAWFRMRGRNETQFPAGFVSGRSAEGERGTHQGPNLRRRYRTGSLGHKAVQAHVRRGQSKATEDATHDVVS